MLYKNKNSVHNEIKYKSYKNKLHNVIRNAKKSYYGSKIEENMTNLSTSWNKLYDCFMNLGPGLAEKCHYNQHNHENISKVTT